MQYGGLGCDRRRGRTKWPWCGYAVLRLKDEGGREIVIRGALAGLNRGQLLEVSGLWEKHPDFGMRFKVDAYQIRLPGTREGIIRFLSSGSIPGIGVILGEIIGGKFCFFGNHFYLNILFF